MDRFIIMELRLFLFSMSCSFGVSIRLRLIQVPVKVKKQYHSFHRPAISLIVSWSHTIIGRLNAGLLG